MKNLLLYFSFFLIAISSCAQIPEVRPQTVNPAFDQKISNSISFTIPTMGVKELNETTEKVYILDAREKEEYDISHIPNAKYIGYNQLEIKALLGIPKDAKIVLYCSIGYRSEKIGEKLRKKGFSNVHNLYGSIFEWVNQGYRVVDKQNQPTNRVHTYNKNWSQWVEEEKVEKVW